MNPQYSLITAIGTPLKDDESLHVEGLEAQIEDQWSSGVTGLLVGGSMGAMQLLSDETYFALIDRSIEFNRGRCELLMGAGDASFARTRDRIEILNNRKIDGVVILSPYLFRFSQAELIDYFIALADASKHPLYLYDLPSLTGTKLDFETVSTLARHRNIAGIKCSGELGWTRQLVDAALAGFRVIVSAVDMIDVLMRAGFREHLDGVFAAAPHWAVGLANSAAQFDWPGAATFQHKINALLKVLRAYGVFATFTVIMNSRGIAGRFSPRPYRPLDAERAEMMLQLPVIRELLFAA